MTLVILRITILAATNVTFELCDSGMLHPMNSQVWSILKSSAANLAPVRVAPTVGGFMNSQTLQTCIAPMTLRTLVFSKARAMRHCALQKQKQILPMPGNQRSTILTVFHIF